MKQKKDYIEMVFSSTLVVERLVLPEWDPDSASFKAWKKSAAEALAEKIVEDNLMMHNSSYDCHSNFIHEIFTVLVARRAKDLP